MQESPIVGGNFNNGVNAGLRYWNLNNSPANANIYIGARLILAITKEVIARYYPYHLVKIKSKRQGVVGLISKYLETLKRKKLITIKRIGNIYDRITEYENIKQAITNASRKKKDRKPVRKILENIDFYTMEIKEVLENKTYNPSPYVEQKIRDGANGKERLIFKPKFYPDQCIHWALMQIIEPIFNKGMYEYTCGSVPNRGIHYAQDRIKKWIKKDRKYTKYVLQIDITKFYPSVNHDALKNMLRTKIKDRDVLLLLDKIIDSADEGLPIGNYTSQWLANFYLQEFDYFIKQKLMAKYYVRYMDDCIIFGNNKKKLHKSLREIREYLESIGLKVKDNWQVFKLDKRPLDFLGFKFYRTHVTMRKRNALRIKRRAKRIYKRGNLNYKDSAAMISYLGWLKHSDSHNYYKKNIEPYVDVKKMKEVISVESRRRNKAPKYLH